MSKTPCREWFDPAVHRLAREVARAGGTHGCLPDQPDLLSACVVWGPGTQLGKVQLTRVPWAASAKPWRAAG